MLRHVSTIGAMALGLGLALALAAPSAASAQARKPTRDAVLTTGSSTVYPFTKAVAERFAAQPGNKPPTVISTGTVHGFNRFCQGAGLTHPDIQSASRRMNAIEFSMCAKNGVNEIMELPIGHDGIVVAFRKDAPPVKLTRQEIWLAVAKEVPVAGQLVANPHQRWSQINPALPDWPIEVLGPPPTSGTRDSFTDMVMQNGCRGFAEVRAIADAARQRAVCNTVREDGKWVDSGEDDTRIVGRIVAAPPGLVGVFGYSFLAENAARLAAATVDGTAPTPAAIASGQYPLSRPLFLYVKRPNLKTIPGLAGFIAEYASEAALGPSGYLITRGLVPLDDAQRAKLRDDVAAGAIMLRRPTS